MCAPRRKGRGEEKKERGGKKNRFANERDDPRVSYIVRETSDRRFVEVREKEQFHQRGEEATRSSRASLYEFIDIGSSRPSGRTRRRTGSSGSSVVDDLPG